MEIDFLALNMLDCKMLTQPRFKGGRKAIEKRARLVLDNRLTFRHLLPRGPEGKWGLSSVFSPLAFPLLLLWWSRSWMHKRSHSRHHQVIAQLQGWLTPDQSADNLIFSHFAINQEATQSLSPSTDVYHTHAVFSSRQVLLLCRKKTFLASKTARRRRSSSPSACRRRSRLSVLGVSQNENWSLVWEL